jgi:hypothetical protein
MKIYNAVKTGDAAKTIISRSLSERKMTWKNGTFRVKSCHCECGETTLYTFLAICPDRGFSNEVIYISVAVCESCGDDDAPESDVLNLNIW